MDCAGYSRDKPIQAPVPEVITGLVEGEVLGLELIRNPSQVVAVVTAAGAVAGAVIPDVNLVSCLELGVPYIATVTSIQGGHVMVKVEAA